MHQTENLDDGYMGSGKYLKRAIKKYGIDAFEKEILHVFDNEDDMRAKEKELVTEEYCLREDTYNICIGGKGGFWYLNNVYLTEEEILDRNRKNVKLTQTKEAREKAKKTIIDNNIKLGFATWEKEKIVEVVLKGLPKRTGVKRSLESRRKMSKLALGKNNSQYGTMWITNGTKNRKIKKDLTIPDGWYKGRVIKKES